MHYGPPDGFCFEIFDGIIPVQVVVFYHFLICVLIFGISYLMRFVKRILVDVTPLFLQDDQLLFDYNVEQRVNDFIDAALTQVFIFFSDFYLIRIYHYFKKEFINT